MNDAHLKAFARMLEVDDAHLSAGAKALLQAACQIPSDQERVSRETQGNPPMTPAQHRKRLRAWRAGRCRAVVDVLDIIANDVDSVAQTLADNAGGLRECHDPIIHDMETRILAKMEQHTLLCEFALAQAESELSYIAGTCAFPPWERANPTIYEPQYARNPQ